MVHVMPMDWTSWTAGQSVPVFVYSNADSVELFLNGTSLGSKTMTPTRAPPTLCQWSVPFAAGTLQAKATKNGAVVATDTVQTAGAPAEVALSRGPDDNRRRRERPRVRRGGHRRREGRRRAPGINTIDFAVTGAGTMVGVDDGDPTNHDSYKGTSHAAFSGKLMAIIRSTTTPGTITVNASSGSLTAGSTVVTTTAP